VVDSIADLKVKDVLSRLYREDDEQRKAGLPSSQRTRNVGAETGQFLYLLALATSAKSILEMGSSNGVSTIWFTDAMRKTGGRVTGTELLPERAAQANSNLAAAGLSDFGRVIPGEARETARRVSGPFDIIFIDAEKEDYVEHFIAAFPLLRARGLVVADNVTSHDLSEYQAMVRERDDVETMTIPLDRGLELTYKK
jgi:predicted O-methyltransferase YrrM